MKEIKEVLKKELEGGTYFLHHETVFEKIQAVLTPGGGHEKDSELEEIALELMAGMALYHPEDCAAELKRQLNRPDLRPESKIKSLEPVRQSFANPDRALSSIRLYKDYFRAPELSVRDFSSRSFLQMLTEMRVGGGIDSVVALGECRSEITGILKGLSETGWLEADELLDLLELSN